jgi:hypothetical protein
MRNNVFCMVCGNTRALDSSLGLVLQENSKKLKHTVAPKLQIFVYEWLKQEIFLAKTWGKS